jgi:hypothetical protein
MARVIDPMSNEEIRAANDRQRIIELLEEQNALLRAVLKQGAQRLAGRAPAPPKLLAERNGE